MGSWSLTGTFLLIGLFLAIVSYILSQINVANPLTGSETSILRVIFSWINPF